MWLRSVKDVRRSLVSRLYRDERVMRLVTGVALPIARGPLAGCGWAAATRLNFLIGTYEKEQTRLFQEAISPGQVVYDVGAHFGYYTLLASRLAGPTGQVFALEPSPFNLPLLRKHVKLNRCDNTAIFDVAVSDHTGFARFESRCGMGVGRLAQTGDLEVRVVALDDLIAEQGLPMPDVLKIDVEGAEMDVLNGGRKTIADARPTIFLSIHGEEMRTRCLRFLEDIGYTIRPVRKERLEQDSEFLATCPSPCPAYPISART